MTEEKQTNDTKIEPAETAGKINQEEKQEDKKVQVEIKNKDFRNNNVARTAKSVFGAKKGANKKFSKRHERKKDDFEQRILDLARVTRVMAGGKRMRFRACVIVGDKKGKVGIGMGKGIDVAIAMTKAGNVARKNIVEVPMVNETIPHEVFYKFGAGKVLLKPSRRGKGVIAGGVVRVILELAGIRNVTSKILGTNNKVTNAKCTIEALRSLKKVERQKREEKKIQKTEESKQKEEVVKTEKVKEEETKKEDKK